MPTSMTAVAYTFAKVLAISGLLGVASADVNPFNSTRCIPQGVGSCNVEVVISRKEYNWITHDATWIVNSASVYDYQCDVLANAAVNQDRIEMTTEMLPYPVVISQLHKGNSRDKFQMQYGDYDSGLIPWACDTLSGGTHKVKSCLHGFDCTLTGTPQ